MSQLIDTEAFSLDSNKKKFKDLSGKEHEIDIAKISFRAGVTIADKYPRIIELSQEVAKADGGKNSTELYKIMAEVFSAICIGQDKSITVDFIYDNIEFTIVSLLLRECMESVRGFLSKQMGGEEKGSQEEKSA